MKPAAVDPGDALAGFEKVVNATNAARNQFLKQLETYEAAVQKVQNAATQYNKVVAKDTFGLDEKNTEDKKKIIQARKIMMDSMSELLSQCAEAIAAVDQIENGLDSDLT
jgi:Na+/phosphate symporter